MLAFLIKTTMEKSGLTPEKKRTMVSAKQASARKKLKEAQIAEKKAFEAVKKAHDAVTEAKEKHGEAIYRREQASFDVELYAAMMLSLGGNVAMDKVNPYKQKRCILFLIMMEKTFRVYQ